MAVVERRRLARLSRPLLDARAYCGARPRASA
jgi:hypothetical protein